MSKTNVIIVYEIIPVAQTQVSQFCVNFSYLGIKFLSISSAKVTLLDLRITLPTSLYFVIMSSTSSRSQLLTPTWIITSFGSSFIKSLNLPVTSLTFSPPLLLTRTLTSLLESFSSSILCSCESPTTITLSLLCHLEFAMLRGIFYLCCPFPKFNYDFRIAVEALNFQ